jgi:hypothetical protein
LASSHGYGGPNRQRTTPEGSCCARTPTPMPILPETCWQGYAEPAAPPVEPWQWGACPPLPPALARAAQEIAAGGSTRSTRLPSSRRSRRTRWPLCGFARGPPRRENPLSHPKAARKQGPCVGFLWRPRATHRQCDCESNCGSCNGAVPEQSGISCGEASPRHDTNPWRGFFS